MRKNLNKEQNAEAIAWRREKVQDLLIKGIRNHSKIASIMQIPRSTITLDIMYLRKKARENIKSYIDERLPESFELILGGLNEIVREMWDSAQKADEEGDIRSKISALGLVKDCLNMELNILSDANVIDEAAKFVEINKAEIENKKQERKEKEVTAVTTTDTAETITLDGIKCCQ